MTNPNKIKLGSVSKDDYIRQLQRRNVRNHKIHEKDQGCHPKNDKTYKQEEKDISCVTFRPQKAEKQLLKNTEDNKYFSFDKKAYLSRLCDCSNNAMRVDRSYRTSLLKNGVSNSAGAKMYKTIRKNELVHVQDTYWVSNAGGSKIYLTGRKSKTCCKETISTQPNHLGHLQDRSCCDKV